MDVKCVRLITGEDVIAEFENDGEKVSLINPVQVLRVPGGGTDQPNFGFIPFPLVSNDKTIVINNDKIVFVCEPSEEFLNQYNTIFGNIITPSSKIII